MKTNYPIYFKEQLRFHMKGRGISAAELSRNTGIPKQRISDWLAGIVPNNIFYLRCLAEYFEVCIDELCFSSCADDYQ